MLIDMITLWRCKGIAKEKHLNSSIFECLHNKNIVLIQWSKVQMVSMYCFLFNSQQTQDVKFEFYKLIP